MKKLSLVVPYRNRELHLAKFVPYIDNFLTESRIDYHLFIIEQDDDLPFNRAKLLNIGFEESREFDYFCFHDVDMLPLESDYTFPTLPTHLAARVEQFNWGLAYETYFGGVTMFSKSDFLLVNGYSNQYFGWGAEDDDLWNRCIRKGIKPSRRNGKYSSLDHERIIDRNLWQKNYEYLTSQQRSPETHLNIIEKDGLSSLRYDKISVEKITKNATKIKVKI